MKTILITGANSGIGKATAAELAVKGDQIVFIARSIQKAGAVKKEIISSLGNTKVDIIIGDLLFLAEVRKSAEMFKEKYKNLDVLINNAGVCLPEYFVKCKAVAPENESINLENQKILWEKSVQLSGLNV